MIRTYIRGVAALSRTLAVFATLLMVAAMLVVCQMILMRYAFRMPTIWQTDFVVFSATAAMFLGAPYVLLTGGHVGVDAVEMLLQPRTRAKLRVLASCLGLFFCGIMLAATWIQFYEAWENDWHHSSVWAPPLWIPLSILPLSFFMLCLQYVAHIFTLLTTPIENTAPAGGEVVP